MSQPMPPQGVPYQQGPQPGPYQPPPGQYPQQQFIPSPKKSRGWVLPGIAGFALGTIIGCAGGSSLGGGTAAVPGAAARTVTVTSAAKPGATVTETAKIPAAPAQPKAPAAGATIGDGTGQEVGTDIAPGSYRAKVDTALCYFQVSGDENGTEIKSNGAGKGTHRVRLKKGDFFDTQGCGTWTKV
ncbi:MAG TPA: hypothetical protein VEQ66_05275 [Propionibacteriaceae bacterium]|nr:hypothetical protein [Propionibacteriaceae bacterium]